MGREIRMVPPNWEHPTRTDKYGRDGYQPMFDEDFATAKAEWLDGLAKWEAGERPSYFDADDHAKNWTYWEYHGNPPEQKYYRPWSESEATWFQLWETVSEGTPVSPPFATADELIAYLADHGDFWDQKRCLERDWASLWGGTPGVSGWGVERATAFVKAGWAPSMIAKDGQAIDGKLAV